MNKVIQTAIQVTRVDSKEKTARRSKELGSSSSLVVADPKVCHMASEPRSMLILLHLTCYKSSLYVVVSGFVSMVGNIVDSQSKP